MAGYYACGRCWDRVDGPADAHTCLDRQPSEGGSMVLLSDDYRTEMADLLRDDLILLMADGLMSHHNPFSPGVPFSQIMHAGGTPKFDFMRAASDEYRSRGGTKARTIGGVANALIAILTVSR